MPACEDKSIGPGAGRRRRAGSALDAGHLVRTWRRKVGLTQEELARELSVTFATVSRWENGRVLPSRLAWRALVEAAERLGLPLGMASAVETRRRS